MYKHILFDLDGVIAESEIGSFKLLQNISSKHGVQLPSSEMSLRSGKRIANFVHETSFIPKSKADKISEDFYSEYVKNPANFITPIDPTVSFIQKYAEHMNFSIVSMSSQEEIGKILRNFGLRGKFKHIISADDTPSPKPNPAIYQIALKILDEDTRSCASVEDSLVGALSSTGTGLDTFIFSQKPNQRAQFTRLPIKGFINSFSDYEHYFCRRP